MAWNKKNTLIVTTIGSVLIVAVCFFMSTMLYVPPIVNGATELERKDLALGTDVIIVLGEPQGKLIYDQGYGTVSAYINPYELKQLNDVYWAITCKFWAGGVGLIGFVIYIWE